MKQALLWMFVCLTLSRVLSAQAEPAQRTVTPRQYGADVPSPRHLLGIRAV